MSSNNDNAMTRFLFAILRQKCLKDIDWNQVAHDPILLQEISNGHAARMRYSRFRSAMLGLEPQRRNRTTATKSKVTKPKKETKPKREDGIKDEAVKTERMKQDPGAELDSLSYLSKMSSPKVKQERMRAEMGPLAASLAESSTIDGQTHFQSRLLTPCSDADSISVSDLLHSEPTYDYAASNAACGHEDAVAWAHDSPFQAFGLSYDLDTYAGYCEHQQDHHARDHCDPSEIMDQTSGHATIKHEDWNMHYE